MKKTTLALFSALALSSAAQAGVFIDDHAVEVRKEAIDKVVKTKVKKGDTTNKISTINYQQKISVFHHIGDKTSTEKLKGFGNDLTIKETLENVVPDTWKVEASKQVNLDKKVNFAGGETWNDTIERVGKDNFSATFDWKNQTLKITPIDTRIQADTVSSTFDQTNGKTTSSKSARVAKLHKTKSHSAKSMKSDKSDSMTSSSKATSTGGTWVLSKNHTLRQNIELWAKRAGWTVAWKAPDYYVVADAKFTGEIDSETGPVISVLKYYEDSNLPLRVNILGGNKVINVESRNYIPRDAVDLSIDIQ